MRIRLISKIFCSPPMDRGYALAKLLVVDDEEKFRLCVTAILSALGYSVIEAKDGLEAYELYQKWHGEIALVITDIEMPRLNGIDTVRKIKGVDPYAKVVFMSGNPSEIPEDVRADAYLTKPFKAMHLHAVVKEVLGNDTPAPWVA